MRRKLSFILVFLLIFSTVSGYTVKAEAVSPDTIRAEMLGLGESKGDVPISYKQYMELLDILVPLCNPEKEGEWKDKLSAARKSDQIITRQEAMLLLYYVADLLGPEYNYQNGDWVKLLNQLGDSSFDDMTWDYPLVAGWEQPANIYWYESEKDFDEWDNHMIAAYFYSLGRQQMLSSWFGYSSNDLLFDYDEQSNSMRLKDNLTSDEALLSALRFYESIMR